MRKFLMATALVAMVACGDKKEPAADAGAAAAPATPPAATGTMAGTMDSAAMAKMKADSGMKAAADSAMKKKAHDDSAAAMKKKP